MTRPISGYPPKRACSTSRHAVLPSLQSQTRQTAPRHFPHQAGHHQIGADDRSYELPLVQQEVEAVRAAHAIRGRASKSPLKHRFRLWQRYLFTVIVNGLCKAENTAVAVESRGFGAYAERTFVKDFHWTVSGLALVVVYLLLIGGLLYWERAR